MILDTSYALDPFSDDVPSSPVETILPDYTSEVTRPPSYIAPRRPTAPHIYTFTPWNAKLTLLMPPRMAREQSPIYNISVTLNLNPFAPLSYITTVRRGPSVEGPIVGEFELAIAHQRAIVSMDRQSTKIQNVLFPLEISMDSRIWKWKFAGIELKWDCRTKLDDGSPLCICFDSQNHQIASFVPPPITASPPLPDATLTVFPDGHDCFDHILISSLIIERKMTLSF